jgi:hypothetical protein
MTSRRCLPGPSPGPLAIQHEWKRGLTVCATWLLTGTNACTQATATVAVLSDVLLYLLCCRLDELPRCHRSSHCAGAVAGGPPRNAVWDHVTARTWKAGMCAADSGDAVMADSLLPGHADGQERGARGQARERNGAARQRAGRALRLACFLGAI